jgi:hypothetical protein
MYVSNVAKIPRSVQILGRSLLIWSDFQALFEFIIELGKYNHNNMNHLCKWSQLILFKVRVPLFEMQPTTTMNKTVGQPPVSMNKIFQIA